MACDTGPLFGRGLNGDGPPVMVDKAAHLLKRAKVMRVGLVPVTRPFSIKIGVSCAASSSVGMTSSRVPLWLALEKLTVTEPDNMASATLC